MFGDTSIVASYRCFGELNITYPRTTYIIVYSQGRIIAELIGRPRSLQYTELYLYCIWLATCNFLSFKHHA